MTQANDDILAPGPLDRDRAEAGNAFDELKNPWGWDGFTTPDLPRCPLASRAVALVYKQTLLSSLPHGTALAKYLGYVVFQGFTVPRFKFQ